MSETVVVTRHSALLAYLHEKGYIGEYVNVIPHASPEAVRGKHVVGSLPLHLAALAESVTVVPLALPFDMRGKELTLQEVRKYAQPPCTYQIRKLKG